MKTLTTSEALVQCMEALEKLSNENNSIAKETLSKLKEKVIEDSSLIDLQDAKRYRYISSGLFMSDGRPYIAQNVYKDGKFIKSVGLTEQECNDYIDPYILKSQ
jgi:hypothetical protein